MDTMTSHNPNPMPFRNHQFNQSQISQGNAKTQSLIENINNQQNTLKTSEYQPETTKVQNTQSLQSMQQQIIEAQNPYFVQNQKVHGYQYAEKELKIEALRKTTQQVRKSLHKSMSQQSVTSSQVLQQPANGNKISG